MKGQLRGTKIKPVQLVGTHTHLASRILTHEGKGDKKEKKCSGHDIKQIMVPKTGSIIGILKYSDNCFFSVL